MKRNIYFLFLKSNFSYVIYIYFSSKLKGYSKLLKIQRNYRNTLLSYWLDHASFRPTGRRLKSGEAAAAAASPTTMAAPGLCSRHLSSTIFRSIHGRCRRRLSSSLFLPPPPPREELPLQTREPAQWEEARPEWAWIRDPCFCFSFEFGKDNLVFFIFLGGKKYNWCLNGGI